MFPQRAEKKYVIVMAILFLLLAPMLAMVHAQTAFGGNLTACKDGSNGATTTWSATLGSTVSVDLYISGANPGGSSGSVWCITAGSFTYNAAVLQLVKVKDGSFLVDQIINDGQSFFILGQNPAEYANGIGSILGGFGVGNSASSVADPTEDDSGAVLIFQFTVVGYGSSTVNFGDVNVYAYSEASPNSVTVPSATVTVGSPTTATTLNTVPISGIAVNQATALSGTLTTSTGSGIADATVTLTTSYVDSNAVLHTATATVTTAADGSFTYSWTPTANYPYEVYAQYAGDPAINVASIAGFSEYPGSVFIPLSTDLTVTYLPGAKIIFGSLTCSGTGSGLSNEDITLTLTDASGNVIFQDWVETGANGYYIDTLPSYASVPSGYYTITANFDGAGQYAPSTATTGSTGIFVMPEYAYGTLIAIIACFAAFGLFYGNKHQRITHQVNVRNLSEVTGKESNGA